mgnify:CR=1 FL=1
MGKGKRIKSERKFKKQLDAVFKSANEQSRLPHYSQASFLKERRWLLVYLLQFLFLWSLIK